MNVSSIVIQAKSEFIEELVATLEASDFCDYYFHDTAKGKIVVAIEGRNIDEEMGKLRLIEELEHVISAEMMMSYSEDELESERVKLLQSPEVPEVLEDEKLRAEEIIYRGDLKKKL